MVRALQFAPSTFPPLESNCKYTQPCAIYRWDPTQFHHNSTLEWLLVGSNEGRVGQSFILGKDIRYDDFNVSILLFC